MGSSPAEMKEVTTRLLKRGFGRVDLNCGCPANCVTGKGSGASLLKSPDRIWNILRAMVNAKQGYSTRELFQNVAPRPLFIDNHGIMNRGFRLQSWDSPESSQPKFVQASKIPRCFVRMSWQLLRLE